MVMVSNVALGEELMNALVSICSFRVLKENVYLLKLLHIIIFRHVLYRIYKLLYIMHCGI